MVAVYRRPLVLVVVAFALALVAADLLWPEFNEWMNDHQVVAAFATEALLLAGVYLIVEHEITRRQWAKTAEVSRAVVSQLHDAALQIRTTLAVPVLLYLGPSDEERFALARDDEKLVAELPGLLAEESRRIRDDAPPVGRGRLDEAVDEAVGKLGAVFTTWTPGVVGRSALDPVLNYVPGLIEKASRLSMTIREGVGYWLSLEALQAGAEGGLEAATEHARQRFGGRVERLPGGVPRVRWRATEVPRVAA